MSQPRKVVWNAMYHILLCCCCEICNWIYFQWLSFCMCACRLQYGALCHCWNFFFFLLKCQKRFSLCSAKQNFSLQSGMYAKCAMCAQVKNRKKKRTGKCMPKFLHLCLSFYDSFQYACNQQCLWRGQTHKSKHKWNWLKSSRDVLNSIYIEYMNKIDKRARKSHVLLVKTICIWFR